MASVRRRLFEARTGTASLFFSQITRNLCIRCLRCCHSAFLESLWIDLRVERGLTLEQLAEQTGLSKSALGSYEADEYKDISHYALIKLAKFYGVTADYLLGLTETKNHPNAELADLRLSEAMIDLLKSGWIDTGLLCELAAHPDFVKLLADIQIYVEGNAATRIQNLNAWVDVARTEIVEKYQPGEHDKTAGVLQAAHVREGDYFISRVHDDIDAIMEDIQQYHCGRTQTGFRGSGELQGQPGGTTVDGILQADKVTL